MKADAISCLANLHKQAIPLSPERHPDDKMWDQSTAGAMFRVDLADDGTKSSTYATKYFSAFYGQHQEEILSRIGNGQGHLPFCDLEHLGNLVHDIIMGTRPAYSR